MAVLLASGCTILTSDEGDGDAGGSVDEPDSHQITSGGLDRSYVLHVPDSIANPAPLILAFHGAGQTPTGIRNLSDLDGMADSLGFVVAYPRAVDQAGGVWAVNGQGLADQAGIDDVGFTADVIDRLATQHSLDLDRVYVAGLSSGGQFVHRLACELGHRIRATASVAALMLSTTSDACAPPQPVSIVFFHGTADPILRWDGATKDGISLLSADSTIARWAEIGACTGAPDVSMLPDTAMDSTTVDLTRFANCGAGGEVLFYGVIDGGHTWPGARSGAVPGLGRYTNDIDATRIMTDFFFSRR